MLQVTTYDENYWTCNCPGLISEYLHSKTKDACAKCGSRSEDRPDATKAELEVFKVMTKKEA